MDVVIFSPCRSEGGMRRSRGFRGLRSDGLLRGSCKQSFQETKKLTHLRASDQERRKKAQREIVSAVDEQAVKQGLRDKGSAVDGKLDADHQALAADCADEREFGGECGKAFLQLRAASPDVFEKLFVFD